MGRPAFQGFPARASYTPLPTLFFTLLLPKITELAELKVTLHVFWVLSTRRTYPKFITLQELLRDSTLIEALRCAGETPEAALRRGIALAWERGLFVRLTLETAGGPQELYFLNTERDRRALAQIQRGELDLGQLGVFPEEGVETPRQNIFALYEENIGMVTPLVADELKQAEKTYPLLWIEEAFREAVDLNRRNWRYIVRILERWSREGRDGKDRGDNQKNIQPDKYLKGKYARIVQH